jgi:hypothetical protein
VLWPSGAPRACHRLGGGKLKSGKVTNPKPMSPQQQKMQDCAAKWKEEKANSRAKAPAAYNKFMSACLNKNTS